MRIQSNLGKLILLAIVSMIASIGKAADEKDIKIKFGDCTTAVQKTFKREANGATINEVDKDIEHGKTIFEVDVKIEGKNYEIKVAEDGTLLEKVLDEREEDEQEEVKVKLSDCPAAVQKTLKREANGASIETVDKETEDGKTLYEVDVKIDGKNYEINVAENGTLISKALDEEEDNDK